MNKANSRPTGIIIQNMTVHGTNCRIHHVTASMNASSKRFHFIMYADDTTLCSTIYSFNEDSNKNITSDINNELSKINEWLKINKLSLNKSKTKYMISKKQQANIVKPILQIDGINIESVDHFNFLGLTVE